MTLEVEPFTYDCSLRLFRINNIEACADDFGYMEDVSPETAPEFGCGDKSFIRFDNIEEEVLKKYHIDMSEVEKIQDILSEKLHIGRCSLCE